MLADAHPPGIVEARQERQQVGGVWRPEQITHDGRIEALAALSGRCRALTDRNRELASEVKQLRADRWQLRSEMDAAGNLQPVTPPPARANAYFAGDNERRRLECDLHDGVQNELVSLIIKLQLAEEDRHAPPELADTLSALGAQAEAVLNSVREIAHGIYPSSLTAFGLQPALRAQAMRAPIDVCLKGTAPRSTEDSEAAAYFSCLEAIQNVAKHAGHGAHAMLTLHHDSGMLAVCIQDDGRGFDPGRVETGAGLSNMRDRIQTLGGTVKLTSKPGHGTVVTIALPWPARQPKPAPDRSANAAVATTSMTPASMTERSSSSRSPRPAHDYPGSHPY